MSKNRVMFLETAILGVIAFFLFFVVSLAAFTAPQAHAYAVGSTSTNITNGVIAGLGSLGSGNYDVGNSLQNLISPFTGFVNSLKGNNAAMNGDSINGTNFTWPTFSVTPVLESSAQNILNQWLGEFDNWFYSVTGVQLNGIIVALLSLFSWALGLAQQVVNWLLGLFH